MKMSEEDSIVSFLDNSIDAGAAKAYLSLQEYSLFTGTKASDYNFRCYRRKLNPRGVYKNKLIIMVREKL